MPSKVKSSGIKESVSVSWLLVRCSKYAVNFFKGTIGAPINM